MSYSLEAQYAQAFPREFQMGISIGKYVLKSSADAGRDTVRADMDYEVAEWGIANSPDIANPHTSGQATAVRLGAMSEITLRGVKL
jgi:hypothetical protein